MRAALIPGLASVPFVGACSLLTTLDPLGADGGARDAGSEDAQPAFDVPLPPSCKAQNLRCVPVPPPGWSQPFALFAGTTAPTCPADAPLAAMDANDTLGAVPPAQCPACSCVGTGLTCGPANVSAFYGSACASACTGTNSSGTLSNTKCFGFSCTEGQVRSVSVGPSAITGSCTPAVANPTPTLPAVTWGGALRGCRPPTLSRVDCADGELCATKLPSPFGTKMCIAHDGDVPCATPYTESRRIGYTGTTDTRACGSCSCEPPKGDCKETAAIDYGGGGSGERTCFSGGQPVPTPGCVDTWPYHAVSLTATLPPATTCAASGGAPTGTVVAAKPVTICCEP